MPLFTLMGQATWAGGKKVGWFEEWGPRLRHDPAELERRLEEQRATGFSRAGFDRLLKAQDALIAQAAKAKAGSKRHEALVKAYNAAEEIASEAENTLYTPPNFDAIIKSFEDAARIKHALAIHEAAEKGIALYRQQQAEEAERKAIEADDAEITAAFEEHERQEIEAMEQQLDMLQKIAKPFMEHIKIVNEFEDKRKEIDSSTERLIKILGRWKIN